ncbi:PH domain-containing protein [Lentzea sp. JNUCC 0626]|uniref:PH domain-containing protein n=1 Tax=Lentzea sp. JNUCC 0626 TaxID=3367513 RepID=UPI0037486A6B
MTLHRGRAAVVLRRRFDTAFGVLACAGLLAFLTYALLDPFPGKELGGQLELVAALAPTLWFVWMVTAHPVVKVYESGVLVVNWFRAYWVPWAELSSVEATDEVNLVLVSGEKVGVASGAFSIASSVRGNRVQDRIRDAVEAHRPDPVPVGGTGVRKSLDLCPWHFLALVAYLLLIAWLGV